jgi:toxin YoeB
MSSSKPPKSPSPPSPPSEKPGFELILTRCFREDLQYWNATDPKVAGKLLELVKEVERTPFTGIGKPEPLKGPTAGLWSRRISLEHRFVYRVDAGYIYLLQGRHHY